MKFVVIMLRNFVMLFCSHFIKARLINTKLFISILMCKNMLSERFWENSFIKKSVEQSKNKSVKNVIIKHISYESVSSISIVDGT